jgi:hypothetical protein
MVEILKSTKKLVYLNISFYICANIAALSIGKLIKV